MPSCLGQDVVYFMLHSNAQHLTDVRPSVRVQRPAVFLSVVRMQFELGVEGEKEEEVDSKSKLNDYKN